MLDASVTLNIPARRFDRIMKSGAVECRDPESGEVLLVKFMKCNNWNDERFDVDPLSLALSQRFRGESISITSDFEGFDEFLQYYAAIKKTLEAPESTIIEAKLDVGYDLWRYIKAIKYIWHDGLITLSPVSHQNALTCESKFDPEKRILQIAGRSSTLRVPVESYNTILSMLAELDDIRCESSGESPWIQASSDISFKICILPPLFDWLHRSERTFSSSNNIRICTAEGNDPPSFKYVERVACLNIYRAHCGHFAQLTPESIRLIIEHKETSMISMALSELHEEYKKCNIFSPGITLQFDIKPIEGEILVPGTAKSIEVYIIDRPGPTITFEHVGKLATVLTFGSGPGPYCYTIRQNDPILPKLPAIVQWLAELE